MLLTTFLAQLIGVYAIVIGLVILIRKKVFLAVMDGYYKHPSTVFVPGLIAMFLGLLLILQYNYWNDGTLPLVITLFGWAAFLKGLGLLFLPEASVKSIEAFKVKELSWLYGTIVLVLGLYLAGSGFGF